MDDVSADPGDPGDPDYPVRALGPLRVHRVGPSRPAGERPPRRSRDRRGRGMRGPGVFPSTPGTPAQRTRRERFDDLVLTVVEDIEARWHDRLGLVEYAVEDAPQVPDDWDSPVVPLSSLVRGTGGRPTRLVVFRRPIEHRSQSRADLEALVLTVVVEQVAELLGIDAAQVDPRYEPGD